MNDNTDAQHVTEAPHPSRRSPGFGIAVAAIAVGALILGGMAVALGAPNDPLISATAPASSSSVAATATPPAGSHDAMPEHDHTSPVHAGAADHASATGHETTSPCPHSDLALESSTHDHTGRMIVHDSTNGAAPTADDCANAASFVEQVSAATSAYQDIASAEADGYRETKSALDSASPVRHYSRSAKGHENDGQQGDYAIDPSSPEGLVYAFGDDGRTTLVAALFVCRDADCPQPAGPITTWHDHSPNGCPDGNPTCGNGGDRVPKMLHVWLLEGAVDVFAHDFPGAVGPQTDGQSSAVASLGIGGGKAKAAKPESPRR